MNKNKIIKCSLISFVSVFSAFFISNSASARTLEVPGVYGSISSAIKAASAGDLILVSPGTYNENLWVTKNIEIRSVSGRENTIIDGQNKASVVVFYNTSFDGFRSAKISGFTIRNGYSSEGQGGGITFANSDAVVENNFIYSNDARVDGGGVLVSLASNSVIRNNIIDSNGATRFGAGIMIVNNSNPLVYNNQISNNNATGPTFTNGGAGGGGIFVDGNSSPQIIKNTITNNHADHAGGGMSLRVNINSIIEDNVINGNSSAYGGGIHVETEGGSPTIKNNLIYNNQANYSGTFSGSGFGGGISIYNNSKPLITGNSIYENFATNGGGGIVSSENASSTVTSNKIYKNRVTVSSGNYEGGGVYVANSTMTMNNNVIYENEARLGGGIALLDNSIANIQNNTIVKNIAPFDAGRPSGGGIFVRDTISSAYIFNNIISKNQDYQLFEEHKRASIENNLINDDNRGLYFNWDSGEVHDAATLNSHGSINANSNISGNEGFSDLANDDFHISLVSNARDAGGAGNALKYDKEYNFRSSGALPDIGAYEYTTETKKTSPVYRFWSDNVKHHFYTISKDERDTVLNTYFQKEWKYEGEAFRTYDIANCQGFPVYRFWSDKYRGHFYTISESEKNYVIDAYDDSEWKYEGEAYCAENSLKANSTELYRFWSDLYRGHFYTVSPSEKDYVINAYDDSEWKYEGVGYYVYPN